MNKKVKTKIKELKAYHNGHFLNTIDMNGQKNLATLLKRVIDILCIKEFLQDIADDTSRSFEEWSDIVLTQKMIESFEQEFKLIYGKEKK